jgi:hypothetical protein
MTESQRGIGSDKNVTARESSRAVFLFPTIMFSPMVYVAMTHGTENVPSARLDVFPLKSVRKMLKVNVSFRKLT